ncbi:transcription elongation factor GreA [Candidatus Falkowbacteria bacterium]|nr:MAG: transcription elongation factor GreA [Candidatus Falkowbacteria bacterium]
MRMPIRKPGKYTGLKSDPYITKEKYNRLKASLNRLINTERPLAIDDVKEQAAFGDFSDNAAYSIAKGRLRGINNRILKIEGCLKAAIIINENPKGNTVQLGSTVTIEFNEKIKTYKILGSAEVDIAKGIISRHSPLGSALIGKRKGDVIKAKINDQQIVYEILKIE